MQKNPPFIVAISGVGGAGKDSILGVFKKYPKHFAFFVSYTDRPPRDDETPGETYHYISKEEFTHSVLKHEFLEWEQTRGEYRYGRKKADFKTILHSGLIPVMNIDVLGLQKFKKIFKTLSFFIIPPSIEEAQARLTKRGTDSAEGIQHRLERYNLEMSYKAKYDHVVINDNLEKARAEVMEIIDKTIKKGQKTEKTRKNAKNICLLVAILLTLALGFWESLAQHRKAQISGAQNTDVAVSEPQNEAVTTDPTVLPVAVPTAEVKTKIASNPPKHTGSPKNIVADVKKNDDGTTTTTIATGGAATPSCNLSSVGTITTSVNSPQDITYLDQTASHADLGPILKNYMNDTLKWRNEIDSMKEIILCDAGDTGWSGQYIGEYDVAADGKDIISASGVVVLNAYYYKASPIFNDFMKLILSHEYGHHYTMYHKWVDWDLPINVRFPDSYYTTRPLSKASTATDYSLGWKNCEAEIIAEDYSYLFSGYGLQAMSSTYGFPSSAMRAWLQNIGGSLSLEPIVNNSPSLEITAPTPDAVINGSAPFSVSASDDIGVSKVSFYIDSTLISEDASAPYEAMINSQAFENGSHVLKAIASDGTLTAEMTITVQFNNQTVDLEKPTISITNPTQNPFTLVADNTLISVVATDNIAVDKIDFYFEDTLQGSWKKSAINLQTSFAPLPAGTYLLKFIAYDTSGNSTEVILTVIKP